MAKRQRARLVINTAGPHEKSPDWASSRRRADAPYKFLRGECQLTFRGFHLPSTENASKTFPGMAPHCPYPELT
jgi:hypothetical protein